MPNNDWRYLTPPPSPTTPDPTRIVVLMGLIVLTLLVGWAVRG